MKKFWVFILGVITGVVLTILLASLITKASTSGMSFYDEPGEVVNVKCFKVFQALNGGCALAWEYDSYSRDLTVLLWNREGTPYYDQQEIKAPSGKCFRQVGLYRYQAKLGQKTVPIVTLMDK